MVGFNYVLYSTNNKNITMDSKPSKYIINSAGDEIRTHTDSRPRDFKSRAAAITPRPHNQVTYISLDSNQKSLF